jgi:hypothetical protein
MRERRLLLLCLPNGAWQPVVKLTLMKKYLYLRVALPPNHSKGLVGAARERRIEQ